MSPPTFYYPDTPTIPLPDGHRFPAGKYRALYERAVAERILGTAAIVPSPAIGVRELCLAHDPGYVAAVLDGSLDPDIQRRIGLPWSETLVMRALAAVGGSLAAARSALDRGVSGQLAGGTHHAHHAFGSGFCTFNDVAVAALTLLAEGAVKRVAVVDLDVHQGDGNAAILGANPSVFVASMHGEKNFPFRKVASDLDIALPDGTGDLAYLAAQDALLDAVEAFRPDLMFYLSGADALASDSLGRLALSATGLMERDLTIFRFAFERRIPVCVVLGGGYAKPITDTIEGYANTLRSARQVFGF